ncbi:MAG TPA: glycosyl hydrolase 53 family protein [Polyangiaceae bacterium]|nr:glycosyl hydrolase 53 family protein [Polyangiaceae bacterium]
MTFVHRAHRGLAQGSVWLGIALSLACSSEGGGGGSGGKSAGSGGSTQNGGTASSTGGTATSGGASSGGVGNGTGGAALGGTQNGGGGASGGRSASGGEVSNAGKGGGGAASGGAMSGGASSGGANGGVPNGGGGSGGKATGGSANGGSGGSAGNAFKGTFHLGADITDQEVQTEALRGTLLSIMKSHGFNSVRLRTFVDPRASDGYDKTNGYDDITHTVAFGKQIKDAGMGLFIDFHYSDNWADPGKQCVPVAWQKYTTIGELATALHDYTKDSITKLIAGGARPDLVQIGNETTPGMLLHRCDSGGQPTGNNPITGSTSNWANLGALLKAGVDAVREVDPTIMVSFHIDRGGDKASETPGSALQFSTSWLTNALKYTSVDAFGESCYQKYQGDPNSTANTKAGWKSTFTGLASKFPNIKLFAAEYGPMQREVNDVVFELANQQGIGTFNWEPTTQGDWNTGHDLLRRSGSTYTAQPDLALYDQMKIDYASRL